MVDGVDARHDTAHDPRHDDVDEAVRGLWCALVPAAGAIGDDLVRTMLQTHPDWYVDSDPTSRSEWFASVHEHVVRGIRTMAGVADPDERAIHLWRHTGRLRARQGVPMERVLSSYNMGTRLLWEALLDEAATQGMDPGHEVVRVAGRRLWSALDVQNGTMAEAYREERDQVQRRDQHRILSVLDGLLEGRGTDPEFAAECRDVLGLDPDEELVCVVVQAEGPSVEPLRAPQEQLERSGVRSHWQVRGGTHVGLVPMGHLDVARLDRSLESSTRGRVGSPRCGRGWLASRRPTGSRAERPRPRLPARTPSSTRTSGCRRSSSRPAPRSPPCSSRRRSGRSSPCRSGRPSSCSPR
jgi:hypothetical protein